ncbi:MAG: hypothetical protein PF693_13350 [Spirochaetia bacterium]|jgi:cytochrome c-type biogenesis protein CcmH/NrfF|nr:hypothetical protein [Spirochaetia bacterium]
MVKLEIVALYFAPVLVVILVVWFLYTLIRGEFSWQIRRREKKNQINKLNNLKK